MFQCVAWEARRIYFITEDTLEFKEFLEKKLQLLACRMLHVCDVYICIGCVPLVHCTVK